MGQTEYRPNLSVDCRQKPGRGAKRGAVRINRYAYSQLHSFGRNERRKVSPIDRSRALSVVGPEILKKGNCLRAYLTTGLDDDHDPQNGESFTSGLLFLGLVEEELHVKDFLASDQRYARRNCGSRFSDRNQ